MLAKKLIYSIILIQFGILSSPVIASKLPDSLKKHNIQLPQKWDNESAVVIFSDVNNEFFDKGISVGYLESVKRRIKLLDRAAVRRYSKFYFADESDYKISVIKKNGTRNDIDIDKEKVSKNIVPSDVPRLFRSLFSHKSYEKLAVPGLEVGDIIEYSYRKKNTYSKDVGEFAFDPLYFNTDSRYPVLYQRYTFTVSKNFYVNFNSYNGAPGLVELPTNDDSKHPDKTYELVLSNIDRKDDLLFDYELISRPSIKFQVVFIAKSKLYKTNYFVGEMGTPRKTAPSPAELANSFRRYKIGYRQEYNQQKNTFYYSYWTSNRDDRVKALKVWHNYLINKASSAKKYYAFSELFLEAKNYDYQLVAAVPKHFGTFKDILLFDEVVWLFKVQEGDETIYLCWNGKYGEVSDLPPSIRNTKAIAFTNTTNEKKIEHEIILLPDVEPEYNTFKETLNLSLDLVESKIKIRKNSELTGQFRMKEAGKVTAMAEYQKAMDKVSYYARSSYEKYLDQINEYHSLYMEDRAQNSLDDLNVDEYFVDNLEVDMEYINKLTDPEDRVHNKNPGIEFDEEFTVDDGIYTSGENLIIPIGLFIGGQIHVKEEDLERNQEIYVNYPKIYDYTIVLDLPYGYKLETGNGLEYKSECSSGSFVSTVSVEGDKLTIHSVKTYKTDHPSLEDWSNMVDYLQSATDFTQSKILLRKING